MSSVRGQSNSAIARRVGKDRATIARWLAEHPEAIEEAVCLPPIGTGPLIERIDCRTGPMTPAPLLVVDESLQPWYGDPLFLQSMPLVDELAFFASLANPRLKNTNEREVVAIEPGKRMLSRRTVVFPSRFGWPFADARPWPMWPGVRRAAARSVGRPVVAIRLPALMPAALGMGVNRAQLLGMAPHRPGAAAVPIALCGHTPALFDRKGPVHRPASGTAGCSLQAAIKHSVTASTSTRSVDSSGLCGLLGEPLATLNLGAGYLDGHDRLRAQRLQEGASLRVNCPTEPHHSARGNLSSEQNQPGYLCQGRAYAMT
jgi:hypothetical protein